MIVFSDVVTLEPTGPPLQHSRTWVFHVESQEYACTDPVLRTVETQCFKTCLTILRPPANGLYRCHIRLLHLSESASWSFRPVYLIPGQETPVSVMHLPEKTTEPTGFPEEEAFFEALGHEIGYETTTDSQSDSTVAPSESWPNDSYTEVSETYDGVSRPSGSSSLEVQPTVTWEVDLPPSSVNITVEPALVAESLNSSHVSTLQTVKDGRLVHCASDCGVKYLRLTAGDCNHTWPQTPDPGRRNTHTVLKTLSLAVKKFFVVTMILLTFATFLAGYCACFSAPPKTEFLPVTKSFVVTMILLAVATFLAGCFACFIARRRRTPSNDAFIYFNDHYTASETGAQEGEAGRVPDDVDSSSPVAAELNYLDLSGCYPMLTRQSPNSSVAAATADGGGGGGDGGDGTLPWAQLNLLFSTEQYSLLEAGCRPLVSDQPADDDFAAATDGGCRRATVENGYGLSSLNVDSFFDLESYAVEPIPSGETFVNRRETSQLRCSHSTFRVHFGLLCLKERMKLYPTTQRWLRP
nr:unnamed protein product [Spirometra erinaceieuropaei]